MPATGSRRSGFAWSCRRFWPRRLSWDYGCIAMFEGHVTTEWLNDNGRDMRLLSELRFTDSAGRTWVAPAGEVVNGASVPQFLWRLCPPFTGKYRLASVVHDAACSRKPYCSKLAHRMFREACIASGVPSWQAWLMWAAVRVFGPRWGCACK